MRSRSLLDAGIQTDRIFFPCHELDDGLSRSRTHYQSDLSFDLLIFTPGYNRTRSSIWSTLFRGILFRPFDYYYSALGMSPPFFRRNCIVLPTGCFPQIDFSLSLDWESRNSNLHPVHRTQEESKQFTSQKELRSGYPLAVHHNASKTKLSLAA